MRYVYCANCGAKLVITRKALPKYGRIIDIVEYHECYDNPVEFDLTPNEVPAYSVEPDGEGKDKFAQNLNGLQPSPIIAGGFKDTRKPEHVKSNSQSTAPSSVIDNLKSMHNMSPANDVKSGHGGKMGE